MRTRIVCFAFLISCIAFDPIRAQTLDARCASEQSGDACQKAVDLMNYMGPQLGTLISGGNATLGLTGTLGGIGHFSVGVRGNLMQKGTLPDVEATPFTSGPAGAPENYAVRDQVIGFPTADVAVGVFDGVPVGPVRIGAFDVIANVSYVPRVTEDDFSIEPEKGSLRFGFGGRLGLLGESALWPSVSLTYLARNLPTTTIGAVSRGDSAALRDLDIETTAWRLVVGKKFSIFGIAAGYGQDEYDLQARVYYSVDPGFLAPRLRPDPNNLPRANQSVTRSNAFIDLGIDLKLLKLAFEIGQVTGGNIPTYNTFSKPADDDRLYGSVGLRFGL